MYMSMQDGKATGHLNHAKITSHGDMQINFISEKAEKALINQVGIPPIEEIIQNLRQRVTATVQADQEQRLFVPLDSKYVDDTAENSFSLIDHVTQFSTSPDRSIAIFGDAGTGKTQTAEFITTHLIEQNPEAIVLYIKLSNPMIENPRYDLIKETLIKTYNTPPQEADALIKHGQTECPFIFIFDGVDELLNKNQDNIDFPAANGIFSKFNNVHCIFTSRPNISGIADENLRNLFNPNNEFQHHRQARSVELLPFNQKSKDSYIAAYIRDVEKENVTPEKVERIRQRIQAIDFLDDIISKPIMMSLTMRVLKYLERFYEQKKETKRTSDDVRRDLYDLYIFKLFARAKSKPGEKNPPDCSLIECYLLVAIDLCQTMHEERDASILYHRVNPLLARRHANIKESNPAYFRFFCDRFDPKVFESEDEFNTYRIGYQGLEELLIVRPQGQNACTYTLLHDTFIHHIRIISETRLIEGRRKEIQAFIDRQVHKESQNKSIGELIPHTVHQTAKEESQQGQHTSQKIQMTN